MNRISGSFLRRATAAAALTVAAAAVAIGTAAPAGAATGFVRLANNTTPFVLAADTATAGSQVRLQRFIPADAGLQNWAVRTNPGTAALTYVLKQKIKLSNGQLGDGCLDLVADVAQLGKPIVVRPCDGTNSQRWLDVNTVNGGTLFELENKVGLVKLNVFNGAVGGIATEQGNHSGPEQKYRRDAV